MNYIILSKFVYDELKARYNQYCFEYNYSMYIDAYLQNMMSFEGVYRLYCRRAKESEFELIGNQCIIYLIEDRYYKNCLYAKKIKFVDQYKEIQSKLVQTIDLPGEWAPIRFEEIKNQGNFDTTDISHVLHRLKASKKEVDEFDRKWRAWDLYNLKLKELCDKKELESERIINTVSIENNLISIHMNEWKHEYEVGVDLCVHFSGDIESKFVKVGKIETIDAKTGRIDVRCEKYEIINRYLRGTIGKMDRVRVVDFGSRVRIQRQRQAMEKLIQEQTANVNLCNILMGEYDFAQSSQKKISIEDVYGLFGSNLRQKEAYVNALNANDIYLIQGPPGTGKTTIITEIVKYVINQNERVLVSSETNIAVNNVLERVHTMERVIPVRLGKEERIGSECSQFTPSNIAIVIAKETKERFNSFECSEMDINKMISSISTEYRKRRERIHKEIEKKTATLPRENHRKIVYDLIEKYENIVLKANELYSELMNQNKEYLRLKKKKLELQLQQGMIEAQLSIYMSGSMRSGFEEADQRLTIDTAKLQDELTEVIETITVIKEELSKISYETQSGAYKRKIRRGEKTKSELLRYIGDKQPFMGWIHEVKDTIKEIDYLEMQIEHLNKEQQEKIENAKLDYNHKMELWEKSSVIREEWKKSLDETSLVDSIEKVYLKKTNAVFATCTGISSTENGIFSSMNYDYVIIDEAAKCNMLDLLIPLVAGKKIILVGDHKQLYPMIDSKLEDNEFTKQELKIIKEHILFKWLYEERIPDENKTMLNRQYRMHSIISKFVSDHFYNGELFCEKEMNQTNAMTWIDCEESKEIGDGTSYRNDKEALLIIELIKKLDAKYSYGTTIGIICTYKSQAQYIELLIEKIKLHNVILECSTVDAFQGKEKHTIILDIVRSKRVNHFISDENRVNVAVSRAQEMLFVIGKVQLIKENNSDKLRDLYDYILENGEIRSSSYVNTL